MSGEINQISENYGNSKKISELSLEAVEIASSFESRIHIGVAIPIDESQLKPQAYDCDNVAFKSLKGSVQAYTWQKARCYEGMLEERSSKGNPDNHYLLWFFKNGDLFLKWVKADMEEMKKDVRDKRVELQREVYQEAFKQKFLNWVNRIQISKQTKEGE